MASIKFTLSARNDVFRIIAYLSRESGHATAAAYDRSFENFFTRAARTPRIYPLRPELGPFVRMGIVRPYLVLYRHEAEADAITVLRILHGRRNIGLDFMGLS